MDDLLLVKVFETVQDIFQHFYGLGLPQFATSFYVVSQIPIPAELSNNVHIIICLIHIQQFDNIFVVHFLHDVNFGLDRFHIVVVGEYFLIDYLHRSGNVILDATAQVYSGVGTLADDMV